MEAIYKPSVLGCTTIIDQASCLPGIQVDKNLVFFFYNLISDGYIFLADNMVIKSSSLWNNYNYCKNP